MNIFKQTYNLAKSGKLCLVIGTFNELLNFFIPGIFVTEFILHLVLQFLEGLKLQFPIVAIK